MARPLSVRMFSFTIIQINDFHAHIGNEYQLITWSKDKTLRFWPLNRETMQKVGVTNEPGMKGRAKAKQTDETISFRCPPADVENGPALVSAPKGRRSILAGVRTGPGDITINPVLLPQHGSGARASRLERLTLHNNRGSENLDKRALSKSRTSTVLLVAPSNADRRDGTMSKGNARGSKATEPFTWLSSITADANNPVPQARLSSDSRPPSAPDREGSGSGHKRRSMSRSREDEVPREQENTTSLLDESDFVLYLQTPPDLNLSLFRINTVVNKLTPAKVKLERVTFCTIVSNLRLSKPMIK